MSGSPSRTAFCARRRTPPGWRRAKAPTVIATGSAPGARTLATRSSGRRRRAAAGDAGGAPPHAAPTSGDMRRGRHDRGNLRVLDFIDFPFLLGGVLRQPPCRRGCPPCVAGWSISSGILHAWSVAHATSGAATPWRRLEGGRPRRRAREQDRRAAGSGRDVAGVHDAREARAAAEGQRVRRRRPPLSGPSPSSGSSRRRRSAVR